jgi:2'-5' RNA ligase
MHLHAAIVPPRHVLDEVGAALQEACRSAAAAADGPAASRLQTILRRTSRGARSAGPGGPGDSSRLDVIPAGDLSIPVAGFGFVTGGDTLRLTAALKAAAAEIARPTVHFAGGAALEFDGDLNVWVRIAGDINGLREAARGITKVVEPLGFYVDRRKFRPLMAVGTVNDATSAPYLQGFIDALDAFSGQEWELDHVHLMRLSYVAGQQDEVVDRLPLHR